MRYSLVSAGLCLVLLLPLAAQAEMYDRDRKSVV